MPQKEIINLRHQLHRNPEISNNEFETSRRIEEFMKTCLPDSVVELGKTGRAFVFSGREPGSTIMFRAELDALPIEEKTSLPYASMHPGVAHSCGHDGHMSIIAALAQKIAADRPARGRVVLLFQPAEEVEQGARDMVENPLFSTIKPDYIFALHNIPGRELNSVILSEGTFAAASRGMMVKLTGKTSHAAEPENGINPAMAVSRITAELTRLSESTTLFSDLAFLTIIHIKIGELSYGTSPGNASVHLTLRAFENRDMERLICLAEKLIEEIAVDEKLEYEISYNEVFPATVNNIRCTGIVKVAAIENNLPVEMIDTPFRWSEDFAYYTVKYPGCLFGLGAGTDHPQLHNPDYNFPDDLIDTGSELFYSVYKKLSAL